MLSLLKRTLRRRQAKPIPGKEIEAPRPSKPQRGKPEWETVLTASLEQNSLAPTEEVILHAFDLYKEDVYGPHLERQHQMADLHAEIVANFASLQALVPGLIERAKSRHPFEFSQIAKIEEAR